MEWRRIAAASRKPVTLGPLEHLMREMAWAMTMGSSLGWCGDITLFVNGFFGGGPLFECDFGRRDEGGLRMKRRQMM